MKSRRIAVLGAGFAGMAAAATLAKAGHEVHVYERHRQPGGRARTFHSQGFTFDMGPSWYWMPDVFEDFFRAFGSSSVDHYKLQRLDPSYQVIFDAKQPDVMRIPADRKAIDQLFESIEPGSSSRLHSFLEEGRYKYEVGMQEFVHKPGHSITEFADLRVLKSALRLDMFSSVAKAVRSRFADDRLRQLLEFPVLFLGATPENTPALYTLMNYADMCLGTWYPMGGMHRIAQGMQRVCEQQGVEFHFGTEVSRIQVTKKRVSGLSLSQGESAQIDALIAAADYHHVEQQLLPLAARRYRSSYWKQRTMAPSSLLFYLGIRGKVPNLLHHNLFFDADFKEHARNIYDAPAWPKDPLFYACCPSKTDSEVAPAEDENIFLLMPTAPGLSDQSPEMYQHYYQLMIQRLEAFSGASIADRVVVKRTYAQPHFVEDYHSYKGNAYGLANTLLQTAFLKPKMRSRLPNMLYAGHLTTPGPGVPPSIISGQVAAKELLQWLG